ncbi:uncharacterized protein DUF955 [Hydrogenoanaerobacterium saccharovorans]|uniref:IrrE N-terminal-like domain-containing protein n=1 Tax=Hydrogenoanaerobacterium saccharovorans TaxID=474960 RepID=A0A1H8A0S9_9FIRM|nr:ImmA/IrrE family metallo-endopeptidase [Hydrogenoanaerobacterium saccharovorans]RPF48224.1 uncharacterized protein DUF955 [Hydrogenoanaerobacterium saccharovorans]SEM64522.1 protein of unknown function [Hydrogenoanaerobacterium saccharovorans]
MDIKGIVNRLCKQHDARDPFEIAKTMGISIVFEQLGTIRGYYQHAYRQKIIHINCDIDERQQFFTCAHELGHSILHPNLNTPFLRERTFFSVNKLEIQANRFATELLYPDESFKEFLCFTIPQIAQCLNLSESLVEYKIKSLQ